MDTETLEKLKKIRTEIKTINSGGCGIAMLAIYRYLKNNQKLKGDEKFVYLYWNSDDPYYQQNNKYLNEGVGEMQSCCHAVLFHDSKYWDCGGHFECNYNVKMIFSPENEKIIVESCNNIGAWNVCFDREYQLPKIESILNVDLSDIEN